MKLAQQAAIVAALGSTSTVQAAPTWTPTDVTQARRLEVEILNSHTDRNNPDCIVGGFDTENPAKIYVGGPCSELTVNGSDVTPSSNFRWLELSTFYSQIIDQDGGVAPLQGMSYFMHSKEEPTHGEVGIAGTQRVAEPSAKNAGLFLSTTSYLSKASFTYFENTFRVDENEGTCTTCVVPCCDNPGDAGCACAGNTCPTGTPLSAEPGTYKYSILAASYDISSEGDYVAGSTGNGWEYVKKVAGVDVDGEKELQGYLNVYQYIDFTNMRADTLTITDAGGQSQNYSSMTVCTDITKPDTADCPVYGVASISVASGEWTGDFAFPLTYNLGSWVWNPATSTSDTEIAMTKTVLIKMVKPNAALLVGMGIASDAGDAATKKVVFLSYTFDITGIGDATAMSGKWMVYDPTITSATGSSGSGSSGSKSGAGSGSTDSTSGSGAGSGSTDSTGSGSTGSAAVAKASSAFVAKPKLFKLFALFTSALALTIFNAAG